MGLKGLWPWLDDMEAGEAWETGDFEQNLRGGTVAVDGTPWLITCSLYGARRRGGGTDIGTFFLRLAFLRVKCECQVIFVVDYGTVVDERHRSVLNFFGCPLVRSPDGTDGEKVCVFLEGKCNLTATISDDSDCFAFGTCNLICLFKVSRGVRASGSYFSSASVNRLVGYKQWHWIVYATIVGCKQFRQGVPGRGPIYARKCLLPVTHQPLSRETAYLLLRAVAPELGDPEFDQVANVYTQDCILEAGVYAALLLPQMGVVDKIGLYQFVITHCRSYTTEMIGAALMFVDVEDDE